MRYASTLCFALMATFTAPAQEQDEFNLDFETTTKNAQPEGWAIANNASPKQTPESYKSTHHLDSTVVQNGKYSYFIDLTDSKKDWSGCVYDIKGTFSGEKIQLHGYLKTEDVDGWACIWLRLDSDKETAVEFDNMYQAQISGTQNWKEYTLDLDYDQREITRIAFGGMLSGKGKIWVDNFSVTIDGKDISKLQRAGLAAYKAASDTAFRKGSGITSISLTGEKINTLTNLGMLWGFMKYYHPAVVDGEYNMDAELFRILPAVIATKNKYEAGKVMEYWVDKFGVPPACDECVSPKPADSAKLTADYGSLFDQGNLPATLVKKLEYIKNNRQQVKKQYYISLQKYVSNPVFEHEYPYNDTAYPDAGVRLLTLYRYWNMIQYFFPDRHLAETNWNEVLGMFVDDFVTAKDEQEYVLACLKLIEHVSDSHANIWGGTARKRIYAIQGKLLPPFLCSFVEGKLTVTRYFDDLTGVKNVLEPGDVIERIDGRDVSELVKQYLPLTPGSNYTTKLRNMVGNYGWLLKSDNPDMALLIKRGGALKTVSTKRVVVADSLIEKYYYPNRVIEGYKLLDNNIGYIYPAKLKETDLDDIKRMMKKTKGIVVDMRCYPSTFMVYTYSSWLKKKATPFVKFTIPDLTIPGQFTYTQPMKCGGGGGGGYDGKLVILVNEQTQSQAEYTTMALSTVPGAVVVGNTTAGADGNVSEIALPGGITTMISGIGIIYPDGTESQRLGVKIDKVVKPTIQGIKEGRDELMEEALKIINKS